MYINMRKKERQQPVEDDQVNGNYYDLLLQTLTSNSLLEGNTVFEYIVG